MRTLPILVLVAGCTARLVELGPQDAARDMPQDALVDAPVDAAANCIAHGEPPHVPPDLGGACPCTTDPDAGSGCPGGAPCVDCQCASPCNPTVEFPCPADYVCRAADNQQMYCQLHLCNWVDCPPGYACSSKTAQCTDLCPPAEPAPDAPHAPDCCVPELPPDGP